MNIKNRVPRNVKRPYLIAPLVALHLALPPLVLPRLLSAQVVHRRYLLLYGLPFTRHIFRLFLLSIDQGLRIGLHLLLVFHLAPRPQEELFLTRPRSLRRMNLLGQKTRQQIIPLMEFMMVTRLKYLSNLPARIQIFSPLFNRLRKRTRRMLLRKLPFGLGFRR